jgi:arginyl-tRNA synthetase
MSVPSLASAIGAKIVAAAPTSEPFDPQVRPSEHADLQANGLMALAGRLGRKPRDLAGAIAIDLDGTATVAGPGFLNITFPDAVLWQQVDKRLSDPRLGVGASESNVVSIVDYSHPNIAKEMHVGHLRSTIIGDALARMLAFLGGSVIRQNHLGDWGTQFGMLLQYQMENGKVDQLYRQARRQFETDPEFADRARRRVVDLQSGGAESTALWRALVAESKLQFAAVYDRLGVLLTDADVAGESFYNSMLPAVAADLETLGIARWSDGALCVFTGSDDPPLIVQKSDGGFGYAATDLAAIRYRVETLRAKSPEARRAARPLRSGSASADRIFYVVDARQALHFRQVFDTARRAGWLPATVDARHVPFGTMLGPDGRPFKTRAGQTVKLVDLLDAAVERARQFPGSHAEAIGIGALKYFELSTNRIRDYVFDLDRMVSLTGDTGVYLQYAHARLRSILARALPDEPAAVDPALPLAPAERRLILELDRFGDVLVAAVATAEPHQVCGYLARLAQTLTAFYGACPVLKAPPAIRANRLALCRLTADTLRLGLDLLGIASPDRL